MSDPRDIQKPKVQESFNREQLEILSAYQKMLQKLLDDRRSQFEEFYISESSEPDKRLDKIIEDEIKRIKRLVKQWKPFWTEDMTEIGSRTSYSRMRPNNNSDYYRLLRDALSLGLHRRLDEADRLLQSPRSIFESENNLDKTVATLLEIVKSPEHKRMREVNVYKLIRADVKENHSDLDFALQLNHRISQAKTTSHHDEQVKLMKQIEAIACDDNIKKEREGSMKPAALHKLINNSKRHEYIKAMIKTYATVEKKSKVFTSELVKTLKTILVANEQSAKVFAGQQNFSAIQTQALNYADLMLQDIKTILRELFSSGKEPTGVADIKSVLKKNDLSPVEMLANITKIAMQRLDIADNNRDPKTKAFYEAILSGETSQLDELRNHKESKPKKS